MTVMSNLVAFLFSFFSMSENYILTVPDLVIFFKMFLKKYKLYNLIKEIDLGHFFLGSIGHLGLQCFFYCFQILVQKFFWVSFCLKAPIYC